MSIKVALEKLEKSLEFRNWEKNNKDTYFSYAFKIVEEMKPDDWQFGFYNKKKDRITTFILNGNGIKIKPEEEIFKKDDMKVNEVQLDKIKFTFESIISKAQEFQQKNFPKDKSVKTIAILQNLSKLGNVWNITYVTETFNTLNMKIDASNGKILEHHLASVFSFRKE